MCEVDGVEVLPSTSLSDECDHQWCIHLSPCGEFFVWRAADAAYLRREHRIVGRASLSAEISQSTALSISSSTSTPTSLPIRLGLEEVVLLLSRGVVAGIVRDLPEAVQSLAPPTSEQLTTFHSTLRRNAAETELSAVKRRLEMVGHYRQMVDGLQVHEVRKRKKMDNVCESGLTSGDVSIRKRRRAVRLERKQARMRHPNAHSSDCSPSREPSPDTVSTIDVDGAGRSNEGMPGDMPLTIENLLRCYDAGRVSTLHETTDFECSPNGDGSGHYNSRIMRHLPRPTPKEWLRSGESVRLPFPAQTRAGPPNVCTVACWVIGLLPDDRADAGPQELSHRKTVTLMSCHVFKDIWSRGQYITVAARKMGGDFLVYPDDPLVCHASHLVLICPPNDRLPVNQLTARLRISNTVGKILVLATIQPSHFHGICDEALDPSPADDCHQVSVSYASFQWNRPPRPSTHHACNR